MTDDELEKAYFVVKLCGGLESAIRSKVGWFAGNGNHPRRSWYSGDMHELVGTTDV